MVVIMQLVHCHDRKSQTVARLMITVTITHNSYLTSTFYLI